mmetsp:Transcript_16944/g.42967  ORF Transcript_16944/g.42967 Transcript_16944/m.42967 type:complete len:273 (-) Transcript_16944:80-898(-)
MLLAGAALVALTLLAVRWRLRAAERRPPGRGKSEWLLLVTAHPDDESMFFVPLLRAWRRHHGRIHVLCCSTGDYDGQGATRSRELAECCASCFGLSAEHLTLVDSPALQDGPSNSWDAGLICAHVDTVARGLVKDCGPGGVVVTFDNYGVSGHPNHVAVHTGVREFAGSAHGRALGAGGVRYLELESVGFARKYIGPFDALVDLLAARASEPAEHGRLVVSSTDAGLSWRAMAAHASQFVWFRRLFVAFSRYTFLNCLRPLRPAAHRASPAT